MINVALGGAFVSKAPGAPSPQTERSPLEYCASSRYVNEKKSATAALS